MRDLLLLLVIASALLATVRYPFVGILTWAWFTLAAPQQAAYLANQLSLNMLIAAGTIGVLLVRGELWRPRMSVLTWLILAFSFWLCVSQAFSLLPAVSAVPFDRFVKIMVFIFLCALTVTDRLRFHALLWMLVLIMGFYGAKGGVFTVMVVGQTQYYGLDNTILYDNNHMGIALAATLPLLIYLAQRSAHRYVRWGCWGVLALSLVAIVGTHSRGAFVSLLVLAGLIWWRMPHKAITGALGVIIAILGVQLLPEHYTDRMETIGTATEDRSFQQRLEAWEINWLLARENPVTGAGVRVPYTDEAAATVSSYEPRAAHSIYFEVLGGTGFVGLALYVAMLGYGVLAAGRAMKVHAGDPKEEWRAHFARYGRMSLIVFCVGGASVSMEMWEGYLIVLALISSLRMMDPATARADAATHAASDPRARVRSRLPA
jgi:probable O-glycosylation ligase (exosortase A-associated)